MLERIWVIRIWITNDKMQMYSISQSVGNLDLFYEYLVRKHISAQLSLLCIVFEYSTEYIQSVVTVVIAQ